jgi:competence protein ComEC
MAQDNPLDRLRIPRAVAGVIALPRRGPAAPAGFSPDLRAWLVHGIITEVEQRRLFPWIAVSFGLGILLFFQADGRPALWAPLAGCAVFTAAAAAARRHLAPMASMIALAALFAGFTAAVIRHRSVDSPSLARVVITPMTGFIEAVEERGQGARLTLRVTGMDRLVETERPHRVRVAVRSARGLAAGQHIAATARLLPPPQPAWPGGYDFARDAYFRGIGAVGSLVGAIAQPPPTVAPDWRLRVAARVDAARNALTQRIAQAIGGPAGAVAAALVTGKRGLIDEPTNDVLRAAGIYHIVSISGLHMVLAAGTFFWLARALLALSPAVALLWPVKRIAAGAAMVGACAYCLFSGSEVATERSLVMTLVMFGAVLFDRPALSMRNLAIAALIVLAREPETLIGPSFQMSFAAVAALIAVAPWLHPRVGDGAPTFVSRTAGWIARSVVGLLAMTVVASLATAPFAAYHFQTLNPFGLVGNALALPLVSLAVMPAALLGVVAYPFGLDRPIWQLMGFAVAQVLDVSGWVSGFEGSTVVVPALGAGALSAFCLTLLLVSLPASSLRWLAAIPAGAGFALAAAPERYDAFVDREGAGAAVRGPAGRLVLVGRPSGFVVEQWLRADGDSRASDDATLRDGARCDPLGCVVSRSDRRSIAYVQDPKAFEEDCRRAAVVVTPLTAPPTCQASLILDRTFLRAHGATAVRLRDGSVTVRSARPDGPPPPWARPAENPDPPPARRQLPPQRPTRPSQPSIDLPDAIDEADAAAGR